MISLNVHLLPSNYLQNFLLKKSYGTCVIALEETKNCDARISYTVTFQACILLHKQIPKHFQLLNVVQL